MFIESKIPIEELAYKASLKEFAEIKDKIRVVIHALSGETAEEIALHLEMSHNWVQKWVYRFRDKGFEGLYDEPRSGAPSKFPDCQIPAFTKRVLEGPKESGPETVFTWRSFKRILEDEFQVFLSRSRIYCLIHKIGFSCLVPRPRHEKNDPQEMKNWLKETPRKIRRIQKKSQIK